MNKLTNEEVLHVAKLARLKLTEPEIDKFSYQLKALFDEINKINDINPKTDEILINPSENTCVLSKEYKESKINPKSLIENAPKTFDSYIEIRGVFDE